VRHLPFIVSSSENNLLQVLCHVMHNTFRFPCTITCDSEAIEKVTILARSLQSTVLSLPREASLLILDSCSPRRKPTQTCPTLLTNSESTNTGEAIPEEHHLWQAGAYTSGRPSQLSNTMSTSPARRAPPHGTANLAQQTRTRGPGSGTAMPEGSATQTITSAPPHPLPDGMILRLRGVHGPEMEIQTGESQPSTRRGVQWAEDVVDNEGLGRKKSKVCCIFHKTREVGESSSEDDSSSDDSDAGGSPSDDDGAARPVGARGRPSARRRGRKHGHGHDHDNDDDCNHDHGGEKRKPSPNAYERMPRYDVKPLERQPGT